MAFNSGSKITWLNWIAMGILLVNGVYMLRIGDNLTVAIPSLIAGISVLFFNVIVKMGLLRPSDMKID